MIWCHSLYGSKFDFKITYFLLKFHTEFQLMVHLSGSLGCTITVLYCTVLYCTVLTLTEDRGQRTVRTDTDVCNTR